MGRHLNSHESRHRRDIVQFDMTTSAICFSRGLQDENTKPYSARIHMTLLYPILQTGRSAEVCTWYSVRSAPVRNTPSLPLRRTSFCRLLE